MAQREVMVQSQLINRDISDTATLAAMRKVLRHEFVPENIRDMAYADRALSIGFDQTISQPYMVAAMTQELKLKPGSKVLEIGTGSGYQAAVLAEITDSIYTIEIVESLGKLAKERLKRLGYDAVLVKLGDGYHGWPEKAPFDAIVVTAGAETIPLPLVEQLKEGGRMIIPIGPHNGVRQLIRVVKRNGKIKTKEMMAVRFVPFTRIKEH
ncbi:protein-L-isoaspartate(D-aspartate) O-methyltransferase [uncultured Kriegella sp.]|uniref:protein-L-isoaspartate(D-aspartate) O-methyltransferase n=1 Tax=uncultured Kriegella sp. TaxID=1798910 RepID=UPI0030DC41EA|tara:strand:- start:98898 stop:99527 length:630 start_codon:yes stop_codon:yes gene_type:complete